MTKQITNQARSTPSRSTALPSQQKWFVQGLLHVQESVPDQRKYPAACSQTSRCPQRLLIERFVAWRLILQPISSFFLEFYQCGTELLQGHCRRRKQLRKI